MSKVIRRAAAASLLALGAVPAYAQQAAPPAASDTAARPTRVETVVVVGTQIGGKIADAIPVTVVTTEQLDAIAAVSGDELMRSIPQIGDVNFNANNSAQTTNAARGDVGSVDLRNLGIGNTLVLINGRRTVNHPTSQALVNTGSVPVLTYNTNALPTTGIGRVEVLLDGGAALYGSDAVAGVVNVVTRPDFDGLRMSLQYGGAEGTSLTDTQFSLAAGRDFDRGNLSFSLEYTDRTALDWNDAPYTATADLRPLFVGTSHEGVTGADTRNTRGLWPNLQTPGANGILRRGTQALTSAAGAFYIRPSRFGPCAADLGNGICIVNQALQTTGAFRELRYETARGVDVLPDTQRLNLFLTGRYEISDTLELFGEIGFYGANTFRLQPPVINLNPIWVPASNFWNPFGPVTFADGRPNPNRLPGLTNVPAAGLPVRIDNYRFVDAGFQRVNADNYQTRFLVGLKGERWGFNWESALLYSEAWASDRSNSVSSTRLQSSLALSTPDAYNPFNGGCVDTPSFGDCTPSSRTSIDAIVFELKRETRTSLTSIDLRASRQDLVTLPAGPLGIAFGAELRSETQEDDRDPRVDGTQLFVDAVTREVTGSDAAPVSPNPDAKGDRTISAAYLELAVPVVSPEMNIPLVSSLEFQLAGRAENYSDFGGVAKPKIAMAWDLFDGLRVRASYSQGFRAPNLEQLNVPLITRNTTGSDLVRCEADLRARRITDFTRCANGLNFSRRVAGNPNLAPEESENESVGIVFQPRFLPEAMGDLTFTVDYWRIRQTGIVGILGPDVSIALDYRLRLQGSSNPDVIRAAVNADDTAFFAGTGLAPAGRIIAVNDQFVNLLPQTVRGLDIGLVWDIDDTPLGDFTFRFNASQFLEFNREPGPVVDALREARATGVINAATPLPTASDLIRADGRPEWRASGSLTWSKGPFQAAWFTQYIGDAIETGFLNAAGQAWKIDDLTTHNVYVQYQFDRDAGPWSRTRFRIGARNVFDKDPPLTSDGYNGFLHRPYGRYWYASVNKSF